MWQISFRDLDDPTDDIGDLERGNFREAWIGIPRRFTLPIRSPVAHAFSLSLVLGMGLRR